jgi:predicted DNA-binding protein (MmcQ/YjbR family)
MRTINGFQKKTILGDFTLNHDKRINSVLGNELLLRVREIALRFPEVKEEIDKFGHTSFRVRDKPFIMMGETDDGTSLAIKTLKTTQYLLLQQHDRFFKTAYIGQHGWTSIYTNTTLNWEEIAGYITEAYLQTAPKKLTKEILEALKK